MIILCYTYHHTKVFYVTYCILLWVCFKSLNLDSFFTNCFSTLPITINSFYYARMQSYVKTHKMVVATLWWCYCNLECPWYWYICRSWKAKKIQDAYYPFYVAIYKVSFQVARCVYNIWFIFIMITQFQIFVINKTSINVCQNFSFIASKML